ncbi:sulfatase-like hydrolase/transferase, partial [Rhodopirellula sp. UBA1907]
MQPPRNWTIHFSITLVMLLVATKASAADRPNILLIVSDDQGYNDLGQLGNGIITPALDRLANEGTRLTNFYVAWPACTPSRASLLTGRYPQRNGIYDMIRNEAPDYGHRYTPDQYAVTFERIGGMDEREVIIPAVLKRAGYKSGIYGKWDLGALRRMLPTSRGFDDFYGFVNTGIDYFTHERYGVPCMVRNLEPTEEDKGTYCTYLFQREALRFLDEHAGEEPFFLYVPFNAPHNSSSLDPNIRSSVQAPERFKAMYPRVEPETRVTDRYRYGTPATVATPQARRRDYRAAVTCMDAAIGEMLDRLEAKQMLDDTIVVFFSDNGGSGGADNSPLRGQKAQTWEGGIRVPCIVRWPAGKIPAGAVNDEFLTSLELLPSFASAAGLEPPADIVLDGFDWWPTLRGES